MAAAAAAAKLPTTAFLFSSPSHFHHRPALIPIRQHNASCTKPVRRIACKATEVSKVEEGEAGAAAAVPGDGRNWVPVVPLAALPRGERRVIIQDGETILLLWYKDEVFAIENRSPAEGAYSEGLLNARLTQDGCIVCPTTDSTFDLRTGEIKEWYPKNPVLRALTPALRSLFVYPVKTDGENIYIIMGEGLASAGSAEIVFSGRAQPGVTASDVNIEEANEAEIEERQKKLEDWLPITASRKAKWWYSAFHNVTAMVGAGVLGLPYALSQLGCYSTIAFVASLIRGRHDGVNYGVRSSTRAGIIFDVFNALGTIGFAFAGHSVALEIQATIPSMWQGVIVAYFIVAICYFCVSIVGFWAFGNIVEDDILISLEKPSWLIAIANFMVFLHVLGSYQVFAMPFFDIIESFLVIKLKMSPSPMLRIVARSVYVYLNRFWRSVDALISYWRLEKYHYFRKYIQNVLIV